MASNPALRPRNAEATRQAILVSARRAFARAGYDAVGLREIAAGAGVTAILVNRYFGSKEGLFAAVVESTMTSPTVLTEAILASESPGIAIAEALLAATADLPLEGFLIMLHSASNPTAARISREQTEAHHLRSTINIAAGDHRPERAALALSLIAGVQVMRQMIGLSALQDADPNVLANLLGPALEGILGREPPG